MMASVLNTKEETPQKASKRKLSQALADSVNKINTRQFNDPKRLLGNEIAKLKKEFTAKIPMPEALKDNTIPVRTYISRLLKEASFKRKFVRPFNGYEQICDALRESAQRLMAKADNADKAMSAKNPQMASFIEVDEFVRKKLIENDSAPWVINEISNLLF